MKKILTSSVLLLFVFIIGCTADKLEVTNQNEASRTAATTQELLTIPQINNIIDASFQDTGSFSWDNVTDQVLWSATVHGYGILTIGYGAEGQSFRMEENTVLSASKEAIINEVISSEGISRKQLLIEDDAVLNVVDLEIAKLESITALRARNDIRYLEPNGYSFFTSEVFPQNQRSSSGFSKNGQNINTE